MSEFTRLYPNMLQGVCETPVTHVFHSTAILSLILFSNVGQQCISESMFIGITKNLFRFNHIIVNHSQTKIEAQITYTVHLSYLMVVPEMNFSCVFLS